MPHAFRTGEHTPTWVHFTDLYVRLNFFMCVLWISVIKEIHLSII